MSDYTNYYNLPYPTSDDKIDTAFNIQSLAEAIDIKMKEVEETKENSDFNNRIISTSDTGATIRGFSSVEDETEDVQILTEDSVITLDGPTNCTNHLNVDGQIIGNDVISNSMVSANGQLLVNGQATLQSDLITYGHGIFQEYIEVGDGSGRSIAIYAHTVDGGVRVDHDTTGSSIWLGVGISGYNRGIYDRNESSWIIFRDSTGATGIPSDLYLYGHDYKVGHIVGNVSSSSLSCTAETAYNYLSLTVTAGSYVFTFGANATISANMKFGVSISLNSKTRSGNCEQYCYTTTSDVRFAVSNVYVFTSTATVYGVVYFSGSGGNIDSGQMYALRIA